MTPMDYPPKNTVEIVGSIYAAALVASTSWARCLNHGFTVRGGIDYGDIYWDDNTVLGAPFINAYNIESSRADVSRVVCSHNFVKLIYDYLEQATNDSAVRKSQHQTILNDILRALMLDYDGFICLNPHNLYIAEVFPDGTNDFSSTVERLMQGRTSHIYRKYDYLRCILQGSRPGTLSREDISRYIEQHSD